MIIKITNFTEGIHDFDFSESVETIGLKEPFIGDLSLNVRMDKSNSQIVCNCQLNVGVRLSCDRCTKDFEENIVSNFVVTYLIQNEPVDSDDINVYYISPEQDKINLKADAKEYALLSLPMKKLCSDDCKGICYGCGKNLNEEECECTHDEVNPVWAELLKLKKDDGTDN